MANIPTGFVQIPNYPQGLYYNPTTNQAVTGTGQEVSNPALIQSANQSYIMNQPDYQSKLITPETTSMGGLYGQYQGQNYTLDAQGKISPFSQAVSADNPRLNQLIRAGVGVSADEAHQTYEAQREQESQSYLQSLSTDQINEIHQNQALVNQYGQNQANQILYGGRGAGYTGYGNMQGSYQNEVMRQSNPEIIYPKSNVANLPEQPYGTASFMGADVGVAQAKLALSPSYRASVGLPPLAQQSVEESPIAQSQLSQMGSSLVDSPIASIVGGGTLYSSGKVLTSTGQESSMALEQARYQNSQPNVIGGESLVGGGTLTLKETPAVQPVGFSPLRPTPTFGQPVYEYASKVQAMPIMSELKGQSENLIEFTQTKAKEYPALAPVINFVGGAEAQLLRTPEYIQTGAYGLGYAGLQLLEGNKAGLQQSGESFRAQSQKTVQEHPIETILSAGTSLVFMGSSASELSEGMPSGDIYVNAEVQPPMASGGRNYITADLFSSQGKPLGQSTFIYNPKSPDLTVFRTYTSNPSGDIPEVSTGIVQPFTSLKLQPSANIETTPIQQIEYLPAKVASNPELASVGNTGMAIEKGNPELGSEAQSLLTQKALGHAQSSLTSSPLSPTAGLENPQMPDLTYNFKDLYLGRSMGLNSKSVSIIQDVTSGTPKDYSLYTVEQKPSFASNDIPQKAFVSLKNLQAKSPEGVEGAPIEVKSNAPIIGGSGAVELTKTQQAGLASQIAFTLTRQQPIEFSFPSQTVASTVGLGASMLPTQAQAQTKQQTTTKTTANEFPSMQLQETNNQQAVVSYQQKASYPTQKVQAQEQIQQYKSIFSPQFVDVSQPTTEKTMLGVSTASDILSRQKVITSPAQEQQTSELQKVSVLSSQSQPELTGQKIIPSELTIELTSIQTPMPTITPTIHPPQTPITGMPLMPPLPKLNDGGFGGGIFFGSGSSKKGKKKQIGIIDLLSVMNSQNKYGSATSLLLGKHPEIQKYAGSLIGYVPTSEMLNSKQPKKKNISGFKLPKMPKFKKNKFKRLR